MPKMPDDVTNRKDNFGSYLQGKTRSIKNILQALGNTAKQLTPDTVKKINTNLFFYSDAESFKAACQLIENDTDFAAANGKSGKRFKRGLDLYADFLSGKTISTTFKPAKKTSTKSKKTAEEATTDEECTIKTSKENLISYMHGFYGFGNTESKFYLIGQEEGGGEIDHRCDVWKENNCPEVIDIQVMHKEMKGAEHYFNNDVSTVERQKTYAPLIKNIVVPFFNYKEQTDYEFQACHFGRGNGDYLMFVSDLYPLPCHGNDDWPIAYQNKLGMTKTEYRKEYQNERAQHLKVLVEKNQPKLVIMYGGIGDDDFDPFWNEIADPNNDGWEPPYTFNQNNYYIRDNGTTIFVKTPHPLSHTKGKPSISAKINDISYAFFDAVYSSIVDYSKDHHISLS